MKTGALKVNVCRLVVALVFSLVCTFAAVASAQGGPGGSCPGVSPSTIKQAQGSAFAAACIAGQNCASDNAQCKKTALKSSLKASFMNLMTTFNIGPFCAGAIVASVAQSGADGSLSPLGCK